MREPFDRGEERATPPGSPWREAVWRELTRTDLSSFEDMSLLRVLLHGVVIGVMIGVLLLALGLATMVLIWVGDLMF